MTVTIKPVMSVCLASPMVCRWSVVSGRWWVVSGRRSVVTGQQSAPRTAGLDLGPADAPSVTDGRSPVIGTTTGATDERSPVVGTTTGAGTLMARR